jgi:hypothetical protein
MNSHFASLVLGLTQQAEMAMQGKLPPGPEGASPPDARQVAQMLIDTLGMLEQKTKGQLEADEQKLLTEVLTALRFHFVQTGKS